MKKKVLALLIIGVMIFSVTGCGKSENVKLNLDKINSEIASLTKEGFYLPGVPEILECEDCDTFKDMVDVYDSEFKKTFGLTSSSIEQYIVRYNKKSKDMYMILKVFEGKEDKVKKEMKKHFSSKKIKNYLEDTYEGYLIYIVSSDNEKVLELIKSSKEPLFGLLAELPEDQIEDVLKIKKDQLDEFTMYTPMMNVHASTYIIAKPSKGNTDEVEEALENYMSLLEENWKTYLADQYELVKNRKVEKVGDYFIYIISNDNDKVFEIIENNKEE